MDIYTYEEKSKKKKEKIKKEHIRFVTYVFFFYKVKEVGGGTYRT